MTPRPLNLLEIKKQIEADPQRQATRSLVRPVRHGQRGLSAAGRGVCGACDGAQELRITALLKRNAEKDL